jgi:peptide methionine sulfoxide reductase MsrB
MDRRQLIATAAKLASGLIRPGGSGRTMATGEFEVRRTPVEAHAHVRSNTSSKRHGIAASSPLLFEHRKDVLLHRCGQPCSSDAKCERRQMARLRDANRNAVATRRDSSLGMTRTEVCARCGASARFETGRSRPICHCTNRTAPRCQSRQQHRGPQPRPSPRHGPAPRAGRTLRTATSATPWESGSTTAIRFPRAVPRAVPSHA